MPKRAKLVPCRTVGLPRGNANLEGVVAEHVAQHLQPRMVLLFAQVCKSWRAAVTTAPGALLLAMRCALLAPRTGNSYNHVVNLLVKAAAGQVYLPSPLRVLRFAVANRCELATCRGQVPGTRRKVDYKQGCDTLTAFRGHARGLVKNSILRYGVFACWECVSSAANSVDVKRYKKDRDLFKDLTKHAKVISSRSKKSDFVWRSDLRTCSVPEKESGEPIGPLVTYKRVTDLGGAVATLEWLTTQPVLALPTEKEIQVPPGVVLRLSLGLPYQGIKIGEVRSIVGSVGDLIISGVRMFR
jgi:hypothetical protein